MFSNMLQYNILSIILQAVSGEITIMNILFFEHILIHADFDNSPERNVCLFFLQREIPNQVSLIFVKTGKFSGKSMFFLQKSPLFFIFGGENSELCAILTRIF